VTRISTVPILVTGGIRRADVLDDVLRSCDNFVAGIGTGLGLVPDLPNLWARGEDPHPELSRSWMLPKALFAAANTACVQYNWHLN
jgi:hypothetical protein